MVAMSVSHHNQLLLCLAHCLLQYGETPLYVASWKGYKDIAQLLLNRGADVNIATKVKSSILSMQAHTFAVKQSWDYAV